MPFELSEEQELIRRTAREFGDKVLQPLAERMDREAVFPEEARRGLADLGFWGLLLSPDHGGAGLDHVSLVVAVEEMARRSGGAAAVLLAHNVAARALPAKLASQAATGDSLATMTLAEGPLAAQLQGKEPLHGIVRLLPLAGHAHVGAALLQGPQGWVALPPKAAHARWLPEGTLGLRGAQLGQLVLTGARLDRVETDPAIARSLGLAAMATGICQASVEEATRFAKDRVQFGKPIATFDGVRARLAEMATACDAARALTLQAAALADRGQPAARLAAEAKALATEGASAATRLGVKLHGGSGFLKDFAAERLNRDARMLPLLGGETSAQREVAARALLE